MEDSAKERAQAAISNLVTELNAVAAENDRLEKETTRLQGLLNDFTEELTKIRMVLTELLMAYQVCPICFGDNGQHTNDCRWVKAVAGAKEEVSDSVAGDHA